MNKPRNQVFLINGITFLVGILSMTIYPKSTEILATILATGISISIGLRQYKIENDKLFKDLFKEFNDKYDKTFNNELNKIVKKIEDDNDYVITSNEDALIIDYINFSAEEFMWYRKGRIDNDVWKSWFSGILYFLRKPKFKDIVERESMQKDSYYGFFDKLKN